MRWIPPGTNPVGVTRHQSCGSLPGIPCGSCRRLRRWRMRTFSWQRCVDCIGLFATLVTSDCSHSDRVMRPIPPGTNPVGVARHKSCGSLPGIRCGSCRRLRRWRMWTFSWQRCVDCTGLFATLVTSDCSYRDRVMRWIPPGTNPVGVTRHKSCGSLPGIRCGSCRRLRRWRMRSFSCQRCVGCAGLFATLVTSDCSHRDRVMRPIPPGTNPVGVARHKTCGSLPGINLVGAAGGYDGGECGLSAGRGVLTVPASSRPS